MKDAERDNPLTFFWGKYEFLWLLPLEFLIKKILNFELGHIGEKSLTFVEKVGAGKNIRVESPRRFESLQVEISQSCTPLTELSGEQLGQGSVPNFLDQSLCKETKIKATPYYFLHSALMTCIKTKATIIKVWNLITLTNQKQAIMKQHIYSLITFQRECIKMSPKYFT